MYPSLAIINNNSIYSIFGNQHPVSIVEIGLSALPTERYKRNVVRGKLDLVGKINMITNTKICIWFILKIFIFSINGWIDWTFCWCKSVKFY